MRSEQERKTDRKLPIYRKCWKKRKERVIVSLIARFKCGRCKIYGGAEENATHVLTECQNSQGDLMFEEFLSRKGSELGMRKIVEQRKKGKRKREERGLIRQSRAKDNQRRVITNV
ncbi:hypothetical protein WH47_09751 [Habropoda laboriosa]|uniref:Uncharacterized protein n=1 Tax=Habropoda laboriosa TaxID=597456 RepID=A0A0L7QMF1_9HYME|nr:hypothetical protein WH47_09751 [Habropoda laboriosa]